MKLNLLVIGMGGTGSMLMPSIYTNNVTIADGDTYEEANMSRQPFAVNGENKANVIKGLFNKFGTITAIDKMLKGTEEFENLDVIISCVDSNEGRAAAKMIADNHFKPLIIAQNQEWNPSAWLYLPQLENTEYDPFITYGLLNIVGDNSFRCESIKPETSERGQSGLANLASAGHAVTILHSLNQKKWQNYIAESNSLPWPEHKKMKDIKVKEYENNNDNT